MPLCVTVWHTALFYKRLFHDLLVMVCPVLWAIVAWAGVACDNNITHVDPGLEGLILEKAAVCMSGAAADAAHPCRILQQLQGYLEDQQQEDRACRQAACM